ncbi:hypothetical protein L1887_57016 [Cichorium endivia]|nr:hypothetical protein L1887_57016 [Cichorium endivia]
MRSMRPAYSTQYISHGAPHTRNATASLTVDPARLLSFLRSHFTRHASALWHNSLRAEQVVIPFARLESIVIVEDGLADAGESASPPALSRVFLVLFVLFGGRFFVSEERVSGLAEMLCGHLVVRLERVQEPLGLQMLARRTYRDSVVLDDVPNAETVGHNRTKTKHSQRWVAAVRGGHHRMVQLGIACIGEDLGCWLIV